MRILKILGIIFLSIFLFYYLIEFICYSGYIKESYPYSGEGKPFRIYYTEKISNFFVDKYIDFDEKYEQIQFKTLSTNKYNDSNPILLFGGSFAYGNNLEEEKTFQYALEEATKKKVLNFSNAGWAPNNMLYQLKREDFYSNIKNPPSAIVYVYMCADSTFLFREVFINECQVFYDDTPKGLIRSKFSAGQPFYGYFGRQLRHFYANKIVKNEQKEISLVRHFLEARKEVNKHWGDIPFNILVYSYTPEEELHGLEKLHRLGFNVQYAEKFVDESLNQVKYQISEYDMHPNALAWEIISPQFIKNMKSK